MARDSYPGSDPVTLFETYLWSIIFSHAIMAQFLEYKFDDHPDMSETIMQFTFLWMIIKCELHDGLRHIWMVMQFTFYNHP